MNFDSADEVLADPLVRDAILRGIISADGDRVTYQLHQQKSYDWADPEEWVRTWCIAWLVVDREYPAVRLKTEVQVPRRTPNDYADIVIFRDDRCRDVYLLIENKANGQTDADRRQWIEQVFGNANSLRAPLALYEEGDTSILFDVANHPPTERQANRLGTRTALPKQYGDTPAFALIAGGETDIEAVSAASLEAKIRRAHSIIWAGGKRDPLTAFDEWSKMLFAKVMDERTTPTDTPRRFQVGTKETSAAVANRIHQLFREAREEDPAIFTIDVRIALPDTKVMDVVSVLQEVAFTGTDADTIGHAFEHFFGSIFRGELGQYFTPRQLARFTVGVLRISHDDFVLDPTAGSGGFLLEALLQTWHRVDQQFAGQSERQMDRLKSDFAYLHVYGIEIHEILARICKINLLLHHDGHTNIEAGRSCLEVDFTKPRLNPPSEKFSCVVGNPPFGDTVKEGDDDKLGTNHLENFTIATGRRKVDSEQVIVERSIDFLDPGGRFGLVLPDGLLNNQGWQSNCPRTRQYMASRGRIEAIVSLPDHAFRKSGAQNKTSILFFRKFTRAQQRAFNRAFAETQADDESERIDQAVTAADLDYYTFLAEANQIGYAPTGLPVAANDLYRAHPDTGALEDDQTGTILGDWLTFGTNPADYEGRTQPDCMAVRFTDLWRNHRSNRLDPKYHLFQREARRPLLDGWVRVAIRDVMRRRMVQTKPEETPDQRFVVMTIAQTGDIRQREAGKGKAPPDWLGSYFEDMPSKWYAAVSGDVVYSSIDLWKGCIAFVPEGFDGALVTKEFPIYEVIDARLRPEFLQTLLRSRYYQRAFRAITTGHSNRRRTQQDDFEALEIMFPEDPDVQHRLVEDVLVARRNINDAQREGHQAMTGFSDLIDGRGDEELPEIEEGEAEED